VSKLQLLQYISYWNQSFAASVTVPTTDLSRQQRRSTGPTEDIQQRNRLGNCSIFCSANDLSRQQRPQYWTYRGSLGNSTKRPEVPFNRSFLQSQYSTCPSKDSTPLNVRVQASLFKRSYHCIQAWVVIVVIMTSRGHGCFATQKSQLQCEKSASKLTLIQTISCASTLNDSLPTPTE
jgi:hypothetical protein